MGAETSEHDRQSAGWASRSTRHLVSGGWAEGIIRARSWSGTDALPVTWFLETLLNAAREELQRLEREPCCTVARLNELTASVRATVSRHSVAA